MKNHKFMIASLLILVGMGAITVSCKKEQSVKNRRAQVEVVTLKDGGEDDDDPIIQGRVKKKHSLSAIDNAYVETITYSTEKVVNASYSNNEGGFEHRVPVNMYYFRVTVPGQTTPFITDTVRINENSMVTIFIDL